MTGNFIMSKVDAVMYVVLSKAEKLALWGIGWYQWMYNSGKQDVARTEVVITKLICI